MTSEQLACLAIAKSIPQLYKADIGPNQVNIKINKTTLSRYSHRKLTPDLYAYINNSQVFLTNLGVSSSESIFQSSEFERMQQMLATIWLQSQTQIPQGTWAKVIDYFSSMLSRTIENVPVTKSLVISPLASSEFPNSPISKWNEKIVDWMASSGNTLIRVTNDLDFVSYDGVVPWEIGRVQAYSLTPDYVLPFTSMLQGDKDLSEVLVSSNRRGDLIFSTKTRILAARRKNKWTIYDAYNFKNTIRNCLNQGHRIDTSATYRMACCFFQILFDISYRRHGGLIIVDSSKEAFEEYISHAIYSNLDGESPRESNFIPDLQLDTLSPDRKEIRKLVELSSIDGAILVSHKGSVVGFNAMVRSAGSANGARTLAARSAAQQGAISFKVSSDGEISIFFQTPDYTGNEIHEIKFL